MLSRTREVGLALSLAFVSSAGPALAQVCLTPLAAEEPLCNAEMADSPWGTSHRVSYAQASSPHPGPEPGVSVSAEHLILPGPPIALDFTAPYTDGGRAVWGSPLGLEGATVKIDHDTFQLIDLYIPADEEPSPPPVVAGISGAYNVIDRDGRFIVGRTSAIEVFADSVAGDRFSEIALVQRYFLPTQAFCRDGEDIVAGMVLTYDGQIAFATEQGVLGVIPRDPAQMVDANLQTLSLNGADCANPSIPVDELETVSNSLAADEEGGIYLVTSEAMYKFHFDGTTLSQVWRAEYEVDPTLGGVRLGVGSGSTPSLMGTALGDDQFVVITDGQRLMHLVLMWRDEIPPGWQPISPGKDPRIACEFPITFGDPLATESLSEQSVMVRGHSAVVVNNQLQNDSQFDAFPAIVRNALSALEGGNPDEAPFGIERVDWDPLLRSCRGVWANPTVSIPNGIPGMSSATNLVYGLGQKDGVWGLEGIDFDTGASKLFAPGLEQPCSQASLDNVNPLLVPFIQDSLDRLPNSCENSFFAGTEVGPDGAVYTGTFVGASKYTPATIAAVSPRPQAVAGARQGVDLAERALADLGAEPAHALDAIQRGLLQLQADLAAIGAADAAGAIGPDLAAQASADVAAALGHYATAEAAFGSDPLLVTAELNAALADLSGALAALDPCQAAPRASCRTGERSHLVVRYPGDDLRARLTWKLLRIPSTFQADFGDPSGTTDLAMCLYADGTRSASFDLPPAPSGWKIASRVYRYRDAAASVNGFQTVVLRGSTRDRASITVRAQGADLPFVRLPMTEPITAQLVNLESGACWESSFDATDVTRNHDTLLRARSID
ncbi:MAG: hypothetical protein JRG83_11630 [Deltaproteobacteria bacterium]|nr:hypothetical protein [Deltaproteobacteria bacterium]